MILAILAVIKSANGYLTQNRPTFVQSFYHSATYSGKAAVDNNFANQHVNVSGQANPWIQVQLAQSYTINTVFWLMESSSHVTQTINIYIGDNSDLVLNAVCKTDVKGVGLYTCNSPLTGNYVGARREGLYTGEFRVSEIRAYEELPFPLSTSMLSDTSGTVNSSMVNALQFEDANFINEKRATTTTGKFLVDFGSSISIKAVIFLSDSSWILTFGNSAVLSSNPILYNSTSAEYFGRGIEILIQNSGRYLALLTSDSYLDIVFIAVFKSCSINCSASFPVLLTYNLGTTLNISPTCSGSQSTTQGTISSAAPALVATLTKNNTDNSFNIELASNDLSLVGQTLQFILAFTDTSAIYICQPPPLIVQIKCTASVNCQDLGFIQSNLNYFVTETLELNLPACVVTPAICPNTTVGTLASTGATTAPGGFATITKNADGSFKIVLNLSDVSKTGQLYTFTLGISDTSISSASLILPSALTLNVAVKCTKVADCSSSVQNDIPFFIGQTKLLTIPACAISPSFCSNTTTGSLASIGVNTPATGFAIMTKNANNSFQIQLSSSDSTIIQGQVYQFRTTFTASEAQSLTPPSNPQFSVTICKLASLVATPASLTIKQLDNPQTIELSNPTNPAACGSYNYVISPSNNFVVLSGSSITISPTLSTIPQTYTILATSKTVLASPELTSTTNVSVVVSNCQVQSLIAAAQIQNQDYVLGQAKILVLTPNLTQTPACQTQVSYNLNALPSFIQLEGTNIAIFGSDLTQAGTFNVIMSAIVNGSNVIIQLPFQVIARNCTPVGLTATPSNLALTQLQSPAAISLSQTAGPSQCGSYFYSISPANTFVVLSGETIIVSPILETAIQSYQIQITSTMVADPQLFATMTITINVNKCWVTSFAAAAAIANQDYVIGQTKILVPIPILTQTPACSDFVSYTLNAVPSFIQVEGTNIALFGSVLSEAGTINVVVTAKASVSEITIQLPFQVISRDCTPVGFLTSIMSLTLSQLSEANAYLSQNPAPSQCGQYSHALSDSSPGFATLSDDEITFAPQLSDPLKDYTITAISTMIDPPYLSASTSIQLEIVCIVQTLELDMTETTISKFSFKMDKRVEIVMPNYKLNPACLRTLVYRLENVTNGYNARSFPSFLTYDETARLVVLSGQNKLEAGRTYTFKYIVTDEIEEIENMEYSFSIEVSKLSNNPPYFFPALQPKALKVGEIASWLLPDLVDPEGDSFDMILIEFGSAQWITCVIEQNLFDIRGKDSPKIVLNVDGTGPTGIYRFFIEIKDSGGAELNTVLTVIIEADSFLSNQDLSTNSTEGNLTRFDNETQSLNMTNTTGDSNFTNTSLDLNQTETNTTICNQTQENLSCEINTTAESNSTIENPAADIVTGLSSEIQNSNQIQPNSDDNKAQPLVGAFQHKKKKVIQPKKVFVELNLLEWGLGLLLKFSEPLIVLDKEKANKLFKFALLSSQDEKTGKRNLAIEKANSDDFKLDVEFAPDGKSITYTVQLQNPYDISVGAIINSLSAQAQGDQNFFAGKDGPVIIAQIPSLTIQLSAQVVQTDVAQLQSTTEAVANSSKASIVLQAFLTVLIAGSLGLVWGLVGVLQNIGIMAYVNVNYPGNAHKFINQINSIASFSLFPQIIFQPWISIFTKNQEQQNTQITDKFNQRFYQMGIDTSHPISNLGQAGFFLFLTTGWMCFILLVPLFCKLDAAPCKSFRDRSHAWKKNLFWNGWIRLFVEIFQEMLIASFIRLTTFEFGTIYEKGFTIFALLLLVLLIITLIWSSICIYKGRNNYEDEDFQQNYGEILADVHPHSVGAAFFWVAFMLQRVLQVAIVIFLQNKSIFQIQMFLQVAVFRVIYIGWNRPFEMNSQNNLELFNCIMTLFSGYSLIVFSDFTDNGKVRYDSAWNLIGLVAIVCIVNVGLQAKQSIGELVLYFRINYPKWKKWRTLKEILLGLSRESEEHRRSNQNYEPTEQQLHDIQEVEAELEEQKQVHNNVLEEEKGLDNDLQMSNESNQISSQEYANFEDSSYVAEELKDSYFVYQDQLLRSIVEKVGDLNRTEISQAPENIVQYFEPSKEENDDGSITLCTSSRLQKILPLKEQNEDGSVKICVSCKQQSQSNQKEKRRKPFAKVHPLKEEEPRAQKLAEDFQ